MIDVVVSGSVALVSLNRPEKRNALLPEMLVKLADTWERLAGDRMVRCAVLTGAGDQAFCSGGDLGRLIPLYTGGRAAEDEWDDEILADPTIWDRAMLRGVDFLKPVATALNGAAYAGGVELVLASDIRVMSEDATIALTEVRRGMVAGGGALARLHRQVGWAAAMELMLVAEPIDAARALQLGLVNRVVPKADVLPTALDLAERIALGAPIALEKAKQAIVLTTGVPLTDAFRIETELTAVVAATQDAKEGPKAFVEKRPPVFQGK